MDFAYSPRTVELQARLLKFMDDCIYPAEKDYEAELAANTAAGKRWSALQTIEKLKPKAREAGLWNLFLPPTAGGKGSKETGRDFGLSNSDYAPLAEIMGRVPWSPEVFNCSAPDTGNMETIERYGSPALKDRWLQPLLDGKIRSAFAMTEPAVASSDAPNMACQIIDWAMQVHGAGGVSDDFGLAQAYAHARTLRFADGPDEVHRNAIAKQELGEQTSLEDALRTKRA